jgi:hypothetical protein
MVTSVYIVEQPQTVDEIEISKKSQCFKRDFSCITSKGLTEICFCRHTILCVKRVYMNSYVSVKCPQKRFLREVHSRLMVIT